MNYDIFNLNAENREKINFLEEAGYQHNIYLLVGFRSFEYFIHPESQHIITLDYILLSPLDHVKYSVYSAHLGDDFMYYEADIVYEIQASLREQKEDGLELTSISNPNKVTSQDTPKRSTLEILRGD